MKNRHGLRAPLCLLPLFLSFLAMASLLGCASKPPTPPKTQLEIRQLQSRNYSKPPGGMLRVMKALINTLQDEGYIVKNADKDLGFITATRELDVENSTEAFFAYLGANSANPARFRKNSVTEASINISEFGEEVRVRAVFQIKILDNLGGTVSVHRIEDGNSYQEFFAKVDKGIFIERQAL
jgi:hypothetical protein